MAKRSSVVYEKWTNGEKVMGSGADKDWEEPQALELQVGGDHYKNMKIQPVEFITANNLGFLEGNVVKYICRHHAKNGAEDIKKAIHYCEMLLATKYGENK
jgi:hypothetical protein